MYTVMITLRNLLRSFAIATTSVYVVLYTFAYQSTRGKKHGIQDTKKQPHILFILVDDLGWNDVGKICFLLLSIVKQKQFAPSLCVLTFWHKHINKLYVMSKRIQVYGWFRISI